MKKKSYLAYPIGAKVYAINPHYSDDKDGVWKPDGFVRIEPAIVTDIWFSRTGVHYGLETLEGDEWGDSVQESDVGTFNELTKKMRAIWEQYT